jgi:hypothetical protein
MVMNNEYLPLANIDSVDGPADLADGVSVPWAFISSNPGSSVFFVAYVGGGVCGEHLGLAVTETADSITIAAVDEPASDEEACLASPHIEGVSFGLRDLLRDRVLLHAPLSEPWSSVDNPLPRHTPAPEPTPTETASPVLQSEVYVTSEGVGDIRIGKPIPRKSGLVEYDPALCNDSGGKFSGGWKPRPPFDWDTIGAFAFDPVTTTGRIGDPVTRIWITSPAIPTKSGIRVGDTVEKLLSTFPDIEGPDASEGGPLYTVRGYAGKVVFITSPENWNRDARDIIHAILVLPIDKPVPGLATDTLKTCKA